MSRQFSLASNFLRFSSLHIAWLVALLCTCAFVFSLLGDDFEKAARFGKKVETSGGHTCVVWVVDADKNKTLIPTQTNFDS